MVKKVNQEHWRLGINEIRALRPEWPEELVQDYFARGEDFDDLLSTPGVPGVTDHDELENVTPNQHHNQQHEFWGPDHLSQCDTLPVEGDIIQYTGTEWCLTQLGDAGGECYCIKLPAGEDDCKTYACGAYFNGLLNSTATDLWAVKDGTSYTNGEVIENQKGGQVVLTSVFTTSGDSAGLIPDPCAPEFSAELLGDFGTQGAEATGTFSNDGIITMSALLGQTLPNVGGVQGDLFFYRYNQFNAMQLTAGFYTASTQLDVRFARAGDTTLVQSIPGFRTADEIAIVSVAFDIITKTATVWKNWANKTVLNFGAYDNAGGGNAPKLAIGPGNFRGRISYWAFWPTVVSDEEASILNDDWLRNDISYVDPDCNNPCLTYSCSAYEDALKSVIDAKGDGGVWPLTRLNSTDPADDISVHQNDLSVQGTPPGREESSMDNCVPWSSQGGDSGVEWFEDANTTYIGGGGTATGSVGVILKRDGANSSNVVSVRLGPVQARNQITINAITDTSVAVEYRDVSAVTDSKTHSVAAGWNRVYLNYTATTDTLSYSLYVDGILFTGTLDVSAGTGNITTGGRIRVFGSGGVGRSLVQYAYASPTVLTASEIIFLDEAFARTQSDYVDPDPNCGKGGEITPQAGQILEFVEINSDGENIWTPVWKYPPATAADQVLTSLSTTRDDVAFLDRGTKTFFTLEFPTDAKPGDFLVVTG